MEVHTNVAESDIGRLKPGMRVSFTVDAYPGEPFRGAIRDIRNAPQVVQNVVTYDAVIDVDNPDLKLKPGMTATVSVVTDRSRDVLTVPNAALRFTPQDANNERTGNGQRQRAGGAGQDGQRGSRRSSQGQEAADAGGNAAEQNRAQSGGQLASNFAPPSAPVLPGQTRIVWVMGQDGKLDRRRITVGLSDGSATEVVDGNLQEGDTVITGQNVTSAARTQSTQAAPGFGGGAPRMGGGGRR